MKYTRVTALLIASLFAFWPAKGAAAPQPALIVSQFKITANDGQFFMIFNNTDQPIDMAMVQLVYYNHYNLASATSSKIIPLSGLLPAQSYYLVNDGPLTLCYRMLVNSVSLGLSSTAGSVQVTKLSQTSPGAPVTTSVEDSVSWSKTTASGAVQLPPTSQFLLRNPVNSSNNPLILTPGSGSWQVVSTSPSNPCLLTSTVNVPPPLISTSLLLLSSTPPPVTIVNLSAEPAGPYLPAADIGLMAPIVNELLANPGSPGTDAEDEFIELYNPNDKPFDLTNFKLEVGLSTKRVWQFPDGTLLNGKSFTAFRSAQTGLSLSNSGGQARLLDPFGNAISVSEEYGSVKEDQAWALAGTEWFMTTKPTPGQPNVIDAGSAQNSKKQSASSSSTGSAKGAASNAGTSSTGAGTDPEIPEVTTLHPSALVSVAVLAVGYGAYEYKQDLTNKIRRLRADRAVRRKISGKP